LSGLGDAAGTNATRAHAHALSGLPDNHMDALQIRVPSPFRQIVGMTYPMPVNRALIANLTTSHEGILLREMKQKYNTCYNSRILIKSKEFPVKSATLLALSLASLLASSCTSSTSVSDDIVARVNDKEITAAELEKQYQTRLAGTSQLPTPEEAQALKFQLLSQMIDDEILLQMAASAGLTATDAEVETKFTELKSQYTEEKFQEMLKLQKVQPEDIKADMRKSLTQEKLITKEITSRINVSDAEIKEVYEKNKESFNLPEGYHLLHILVTPFSEQQVTNLKRDDAKSPVEAQAKASRLIREIQGGLDFAIVARDWSEDAESAPNGGDLSFRSLEDLNKLDPKLSQAVQKMRVGETSPLIETRFGYHIFKLLARDPGGQKDLSSPQVQTQIRQVIFNQKEQMLRAAFSEVAHNRAQVNNYLAERLLESVGKAPIVTSKEGKKEEPKQPEKTEQKDAPAK
jgi:peptidyl-prolyl cis-trans isomerase SurA